MIGNIFPIFLFTNNKNLFFRPSSIDYDLNDYPDQRNNYPDRYHSYMYSGSSHYNNQHRMNNNNNSRHNNTLTTNDHPDRRSRHSDEYNNSRNDNRNRKEKSSTKDRLDLFNKKFYLIYIFVLFFLVNQQQKEMIYHHINEIHLNNSIHPVHIIIMMNNYILMHIIIDEAMIGMIHGIGIFAFKIIKIIL